MSYDLRSRARGKLDVLFICASAIIILRRKDIVSRLFLHLIYNKVTKVRYSKIEIVMFLGVLLKFIKFCPATHEYNLKKGLQKRYNTLYYIEGRFTALPVK